MKIALFVHCFYPTHFYGTEAYTLALAKNLIQLGHDVTVVSAVFHGEQRQGEIIERYAFEGVPVVSIDKNEWPNTRVKDTYYQAEMAPLLNQVLEDLQPELVHVTHLVNHTAVLLEVLAARSIPACATFTDFFGFCYNNRLELYDGSLCAGPDPRVLNCLACHLKASHAHHGSGRSRRWLKHAAMLPLAARMMYGLQALPPWQHGRVAGVVQDIVQRPLILRTLYQGYRQAIAPTSFLARRTGQTLSVCR